MVEKTRRSIFNPAAFREALERVFAPSVTLSESGEIAVVPASSIKPSPQEGLLGMNRRRFLQFSAGAAVLPVLANITGVGRLASEPVIMAPTGLDRKSTRLNSSHAS